MPTPAVTLAAVEHQDLPALLAAGLPDVVHTRHQVDARTDEHVFTRPATGATVRVLLRIHPHTRTRTEITETGPRGLWDQLVILCTAWERAGRRLPTPEPTPVV